MTASKKQAVKNIIMRAVITFIEGFVGYLSIDMFYGITDFGTLKRVALSVLAGAVATGISAALNVLIEYLKNRSAIEFSPDFDIEDSESTVEVIDDEV